MKVRILCVMKSKGISRPYIIILHIVYLILKYNQNNIKKRVEMYKGHSHWSCVQYSSPVHHVLCTSISTELYGKCVLIQPGLTYSYTDCYWEI